MSITFKGPIFSAARRRAVFTRMTRNISEDITRAAERQVRSNLARSLRHPTGYYESRVNTDLRDDHGEVNDGGVVYGPWLEGTSDKNRSTRFKGYSSFRRAGQEIDREAKRIAASHARRAVRELS